MNKLMFYCLFASCFILQNSFYLYAQFEYHGVCGITEESLAKLSKAPDAVFSIDPNPTNTNFKVAALYFKAANDTFMALGAGYTDSTRCGVAQWPADSLKPNWFGQLLIPTPYDSATVDADTANYPYSITTYFFRMSNGDLWIYGNEVAYDGPGINKASNKAAWQSDNVDIHEWFLNKLSQASLDSLDNDNDDYTDLIIFINRLRYAVGYQGISNGGDYLPSGDISATDPNKPAFRSSYSLLNHSGTYQHQVWSLGERNLICHEIGHQLRNGGHENGLNRWNLMSGAGSNGGIRPSESGIVMSAWERNEISWFAFEDISEDSLDYSLPSLTEAGKAIRIPYDTNDYFVLENRQNEIGFEDIPNDSCDYIVSELAEGLLISVSENGGAPEIIPADNSVASSGGTEDGDATDLFPNGGVTKITPYTTPSTNVGSTETHKAITNIHHSGDTLVFNIYQNYWGTSISTNTTWQVAESPYYIGEDLTVNSGVILTIEPGVVVECAQGAMLTVNGILDAQGTSSNPITFKRHGGSGTWDGIYISGSSASSSELVYCTIRNAVNGIHVSNSDPLIEKCYIYSCSSYPLKLTSGAQPKVLDNKFYAGSTRAVYIYSAGGDFGANEFRTSSGNGYGVYISGSTANPNFDNKWGDGGNLFDLANISSHGAYAAGGYPEFGSHGVREGENDFINRGSSNYIYNNTGSTIDAEYNYWDGTPQSSWFGGSIDYNPYESSSNGAGPSWKIMTNPFQPGFTKYEEGNYTEALAELKLALEQNSESDDAVGAVFKMAMSAFKTDVLVEQEIFLVGLSKSVNLEVQYMSRIWLAYLYFLQKKMQSAEKIALQAPVGSLAERSELLALVSYYSTLGDADAAIRIAEILQSHHKDDYLAFDLGEAAHTKLVFQDNLSKTGAKKNPDYHFSTYPNPFNPSTTIQFNLSTDDHITLQIFDMLGRHVQILINRDMPAGFHSVKWNGRNSKGKEAAAGIYLARLHTGETTRSIKLSLVR